MKKVYSFFLRGILLSALCFFAFGFNPCFAANDRVATLVERAEGFNKQGNHVMAMKLFNQAIALQPNDMNLYYKRAFMFGRLGYYARAIGDFSVVIKNNKKSSAPRFRADCYVAIGQLQKAVDDYLVFLRIRPKDGKVWYYLAETFALMGRRDLALQAINRGILTGSHWSDKLNDLQKKILLGQKITPHKPLSN